MQISVIVPTYNRRDFLLKTLDSVFAQTRPANEVLVVDDGSNDDTRAVVTAYPHPARYHYKPNGGLSSARNAGQRLTSGDALLFLDSDDLLLPQALETLEKALDSHPNAVLAYGRAQIIDAAGRITTPIWQANNEAERDTLWEAMEAVNFIRSAGAVLMRRTALEAVGPWDETLRIEDWDMWLRLAETPGAYFARIREPLLQYRVHGANLSLEEIPMYNGERQLFLKHRERHPAGSPRRRALEDFLATHPPLAPGQRPSGAIISSRHRLLRALLERGGVAPLYRRLPVGTRLRLRGIFGVRPWERG